MDDRTGSALILRRNGAHRDRWPTPSVVVVYNHVPGDEEHAVMARRFADSYRAYPPGCEHSTVIACQNPNLVLGELFAQTLPDVFKFQHDGSGQDIGAYLAIGRLLTDGGMMVCFGGSAYFQRAGWLARMVEAWKRYGPGMYGATATYEVSPHLNTTAFWCPPRLLASYPVQVETRQQRYDFEHGPHALWKLADRAGLPVKLVTWCGEYDWPDWRKPLNIFRRGDQSNCLACWHHHDKFQAADEPTRAAMIHNTDTLTDPLYHLGVYRKRKELELVSRLTFERSHGGFR